MPVELTKLQEAIAESAGVRTLEKTSRAFAQSPGIRALQETSRALAQSSAIKALENFKGLQVPIDVTPKSVLDEGWIRAEAERNAAPLVTRDASLDIRDATLAMLKETRLTVEEMRSTTRWARAACLAAVAMPVLIFAADRLL